MRATFPPEKATSVTMSTFCDGSITRPPHLYLIVYGKCRVVHHSKIVRRNDEMDHSRRLRSCFDNVMIAEMRRMLRRFIHLAPNRMSARRARSRRPLRFLLSDRQTTNSTSNIGASDYLRVCPRAHQWPIVDGSQRVIAGNNTIKASLNRSIVQNGSTPL